MAIPQLHISPIYIHIQNWSKLHLKTIPLPPLGFDSPSIIAGALQDAPNTVKCPSDAAWSRRILLWSVFRDQAPSHFAHGDAGDIPCEYLLNPPRLLWHYFYPFPHATIPITVLSRIRFAGL